MTAEHLIVGTLIALAALYIALRAWRFWKSKSPPCSCGNRTCSPLRHLKKR